MIDRTTPWSSPGEVYDFEDAEGVCVDVEVNHAPAARISALLGPDGEPLMVPYERPMLGFDLSPKKAGS